MRLEQLEHFIEIAHTKSIHLAAENLYLTQPSLSRSLRSLEQELGISLFQRTVKGVQLTSYGETLYPEILQILTALHGLSLHASQLCAENQVQQEPASLRILAFSTLTDTVLGPAVSQLKTIHPNVSVTINNLKLDSFLTLPDFASYDAVLLTDISDLFFPSTVDSVWTRRQLFAESYYAVVSKMHPLSKKQVISLEELSIYPIILPQNGLPVEELMENLLPDKSPIHIFMQSNNHRVITKTLQNHEAVLLTTNTLVRQNFYENPQLCCLPVKRIMGSCFSLFNTHTPHINILEDLFTLIRNIHLQN